MALGKNPTCNLKLCRKLQDVNVFEKTFFINAIVTLIIYRFENFLILFVIVRQVKLVFY